MRRVNNAVVESTKHRVDSQHAGGGVTTNHLKKLRQKYPACVVVIDMVRKDARDFITVDPT